MLREVSAVNVRNAASTTPLTRSGTSIRKKPDTRNKSVLRRGQWARSRKAPEDEQNQCDELDKKERQN